MKHSKIWLFILIALIGIGVVLRLWRHGELFHFTYDEEVFAFVGKRMWVNNHIPLIGGVTPMHVHVAPYFYWFSGFLLGLGRFDPLVWGVAAAAVAGVTIFTLYVAGKKLFSSRVGLIAVFLYVFSFSQNVYDRHWWGIALDGLWGLLVLLGLHGLLRGSKKSIWYLIPVFFLAIHADLSTLVVYLIVALILGFAYIQPRLFQVKSETKLLLKKTGLILALVIITSLTPLIIFDLRHEFSNLRGIIQYIEEVKAGRQGNVPRSVGDTLFFLPRVLTRSLYVFGEPDLATQYSYCKQYAQGKLEAVPSVAAIVIVGMVVTALWLGLRRKEQRTSYLLLLFLFASTYIGIFIYGVIFRGDLFDHYVVTLIAPFYLLVATLIDRFWHRRSIWIVAAVLFLVINLRQLADSSHRFGYADKKKAVNWAIATISDEPFSLDVIGDCFRYNGYRYLFFLYGKEPAKSYVDANFSYLYDRPPASEHPQKLVVIANPDKIETVSYWQEYNKYKNKLIASAKFGNIEVLIIDNSNLQFTGKF